MNTTDPIADYLTRLRNAIKARHRRVDIPASNLKRSLSKILTEQHYISGYTELDDKKQGIIRVSLRYTDGIAAITGLSRFSRPGLRIYKPAEEIPRVLNGLGIAIVSTSQGLMTDKDARQKNIGGEVLCSIW
ncbi:MAG: 30S ribosomal protein S8 [Chlorobiaceae bacterium]|nr:30S ribosomal protein S8 [Chlorobiaceae bacterium]